jgi:hypothetical protein
VQVTWECYRALLDNLPSAISQRHGRIRSLARSALARLISRERTSGRGWSYSRNFPTILTGIIMSTYFGGGAEVHHRRMISQVVYCDFLSMYPTVCTLMDLWRFVIANGLNWHDNTERTTDFLPSITVDEFPQADTWRLLATLVQIAPDTDVLPVRANYGTESQTTIGLNDLTSEMPLWFTLADCIASKLFTGKVPRVIRAITFNRRSRNHGSGR